MGYLDDLNKMNKNNKTNDTKDEFILFTKPVKLRLYAPTEFEQNGNKRIRLNTKVLNGEHKGKYKTFFIPTKIKDDISTTLKILSIALLSEENKDSQNADDVIRTFFENSDKIGRATVTVEFTDPHEFSRKDGTLGKDQYISKISGVTYYTPNNPTGTQQEDQEW